MNDKQELLKRHRRSQKEAQNLSFRTLFIAYLVAFLLMAFTLPKIYIANEIYYTSRDIAALRNKLAVLLEENKELKRELEKIRYKNQIINHLN